MNKLTIDYIFSRGFQISFRPFEAKILLRIYVKGKFSKENWKGTRSNMLAYAEEFLCPFSCLIAVLFFSICCQYSTTKHLVYFGSTSYLKLRFLDNNGYVSPVKVTSLNSRWTYKDVFKSHFSAKSRHLKTDQKHPSGRLLKAFCYQIYTFPWSCCHLQNIKLLRFVLISLPSEIGIYVEEMVSKLCLECRATF